MNRSFSGVKNTVLSYCSWHKYLNENTNGLLRQYWSKSTDFKKVSQSEVEDIIVKLNDRPRKILNYKAPAKSY